jgi:hypothetical protein
LNGKLGGVDSMKERNLAVIEARNKVIEAENDIIAHRQKHGC